MVRLLLDRGAQNDALTKVTSCFKQNWYNIMWESVAAGGVFFPEGGANNPRATSEAALRPESTWPL